MDLAEGRPAFTGRGQKPSSKEVVEAIAAIKKCQKDYFFRKSKPCSCGWHKKAAARKQASFVPPYIFYRNDNQLWY